MKFGVVDPKRLPIFEIREFGSFREALAFVGLSQGEIDHGIVGAWSGFRTSQKGDTTIIQVDEPLLPGGGVGYAVWERCVQGPPGEYWSVGLTLASGPGVFYGLDDRGRNIDLEAKRVPPIVFLGSVEAVERAISEGKVDRPETLINGELIWSWKGEEVFRRRQR